MPSQGSNFYAQYCILIRLPTIDSEEPNWLIAVLYA
jgi:hypothetical protein